MQKLSQNAQTAMSTTKQHHHGTNHGRLFLQTKVSNEIIVETEQLGDQYFTCYRRNGRIAALERYLDEQAAREGHLRWIRKDWHCKSPLEIIMES